MQLTTEQVVYFLGVREIEKEVLRDQVKQLSQVVEQLKQQVEQLKKEKEQFIEKSLVG